MAEDSDSSNNPRPIKVIHHEKGDSIVILWSIENFDATMNVLERVTTSSFTVNGRSEIEWCFILDFQNNPQFIEAILKPVSTIPSDLRVACSVAVEDCSGEYNEGKQSTRVISLTEEYHFSEFINKRWLLLQVERFIKDNKLKIRCELNIATNEMSSKFFTSAEHFKRIREDDVICNLMYNLHETREFKDLTLMVNVADAPLTFEVHKSVLAARSAGFESLFTTLTELQNVKVIEDMNEEVLSALLTYIYTGNPYDIGCMPLGLDQVASEHELPLLKHFTVPNTLSFRSRRKVQQKKLYLKIKNFFSQRSGEVHKGQQRMLSVNFDVGHDFKSTWELFLDFREKKKMHFKLKKIFYEQSPIKIEFNTMVLNNLNRCNSIGLNILMPDDFNRVEYSFEVNMENILASQGSNLTLKIHMEVLFSLVEKYDHQYYTIFSSEICEGGQTMPPDFERLREDVFKMYDSTIYSDLILASHRFEFQVHKFMVALHSSYLVGFLDDSPQQSTLLLQDIKRSDLEIIARFMYSGLLCNLQLNDVGNLLLFVNYYKFFHLRKAIVDILRSNLNVDNALKIACIACDCLEAELQVEALRIANSKPNPNLSPISIDNNSGQDQVRIPHAGMISQEAICQPGLEIEYTETRPQTVKETGLSSQDAFRVDHSRVESNNGEKSPRSSTEHQNPLIIFQDIMKCLDPPSNSEPGVTAEASVARPQIDIDPPKLFQALKQYLDSVKTSEPGQDAASCSTLEVGKENEGIDPETGMKNLNLEKIFRDILDNLYPFKSLELGPATITSPQQAREPRNYALYLDPEKIFQDIMDRVYPKTSPESGKTTVSSSQVRAEREDVARDPRTQRKLLDSANSVQPTARHLDQVTSVQPGIKSQPTARSTNLASENEPSLENKTQAVKAGHNVEGPRALAIHQYPLEFEGLALRAIPVALSRGLLLSSRDVEKTNDPEAKSSAKSKDPEVKSCEENKDKEAISVVKSKDPEVKSSMKNKNEAKSSVKKKDPEASLQPSEKIQNLIASPRTVKEKDYEVASGSKREGSVEDQDSEAVSGSKKKREDS